VLGEPHNGIDACLTPTKKEKKPNDIDTQHSQQNRCKMCDAHTTQMCSERKDTDPSAKEVPICSTRRNGEMCFAEHLKAAHTC
jgi:hypothetical protein